MLVSISIIRVSLSRPYRICLSCRSISIIRALGSSLYLSSSIWSYAVKWWRMHKVGKLESNPNPNPLHLFDRKWKKQSHCLWRTSLRSFQILIQAVSSGLPSLFVPYFDYSSLFLRVYFFLCACCFGSIDLPGLISPSVSPLRLVVGLMVRLVVRLCVASW